MYTREGNALTSGKVAGYVSSGLLTLFLVLGYDRYAQREGLVYLTNIIGIYFFFVTIFPLLTLSFKLCEVRILHWTFLSSFLLIISIYHLIYLDTEVYFSTFLSMLVCWIVFLILGLVASFGTVLSDVAPAIFLH